MQHKEDLWNITERYAESLQNLVRSKEMSQVSNIYHLKCNFANKLVLINNWLLSAGVPVEDLVTELVRGTETTTNALKYISTEDFKVSFDDAFDSVTDIYQNKLLYLIQSKALEVHEHIRKITNDSSLIKMRKFRMMEAVRILKLHPILVDGVRNGVIAPPVLTSLNLIPYAELESYFNRYLKSVEYLLSLTPEMLSEKGVTKTVRYKLKEGIPFLVEQLFSQSRYLKLHPYLITDSAGRAYEFESSLPLNALKEGLTGAWYSNDGDLLDVTVERSKVEKITLSSGVFSKNRFI